ncbi:hypothetical protein DM860_017063 [Cuscuta australis]|uniref:Trehalose 6-phosphate phosphatase n=1 Tax=Cuscuta australis TaxID=267555 RepID=A0A328DMY3_9ASTE|nr:hypothetical protein DM860_017063 [Cuscuta australis]
MTNHNAVVSDPKPCAALPAAVPATAGPPVRGRFITALFESMRNSSPSRRSDDHNNYHSWISSHPSALGMFDEIVKCSKGKKIVIFLDYDGTLSSIVEDPDKAFMTNEMREAVRSIAKHFPTAIVSGRSREKVHDFVQLSQLYYAGSHGMDIKGPTEGNAEAVLYQPAKEFLPMIDEVYNLLLEKTKSVAGAKVDNNKFCLSVHYRCVEEKRWNELCELVKGVTNEYPKLGLSTGRKVLEIRPMIEWDKGKALEFLLEALGFANSEDVLPIYIGDDRTDEDAFKVLRESGGGGIGILVSRAPKETNASYSLKDPLEVMYFLKRLVGWKTSNN